jgi:hypothetical protein
MRDYVGAGRPVTPARDLITRIRLVAKGGARGAGARSRACAVKRVHAGVAPAPVDRRRRSGTAADAAAPVVAPCNGAPAPEPAAEDSAESAEKRRTRRSLAP